MKITFPIIIILILFSCGNNSEKSENQIKIDKLQSKVDSLEKRILLFSTQIQDIDNLKYGINNIKLLAFHWVENQSRADSQEKMELIQQEKDSKVLITKIKESSNISELSVLHHKISKNFDNLLQYVNEIKTTLSSFESYEDISNQFFAQVLIETDGNIDLSVKILMQNIDEIKSIYLKAKMNTQKEIDNLNTEIKKLSAE